jgi:SAM-dependent methyltransferase
MMNLALQEQATYAAAWLAPGYVDNSPGEQLVPAFLEMAGLTAGRGDVLDAGCGAGKGSLALTQAGFAVTMCDLTPTGLLPEAMDLPFYEVCLWHDLKHLYRWSKFDYVYCCDVLEHVPPPFTMLVVHRLLSVAKRGVFLSIALQGDNFGVWVGKPLHQSVQSFTQWRDQLNEIGHVKECRDLLMNGLYYVESR